MENKLKKEIREAILALQEKCKCKFDIPEITLEHPSDTRFGDFSANVAMVIAKQKRNETQNQTQPMNIANNIKKEIGDRLKEEGIERVEVVNPGFINFYLSPEYLLDNLNKVDESYGKSEKGKGKTIFLDYSAPNIAKPFGVHHLLTTFIGDSLKYIYRFEGYNTFAENFLGDWGTQFGQVIYAYKNWGNKEKVESDPINELLALYVKFNQELDKNADLQEKAKAEFRKLEDGDKENRELWSWMREETLKELKVLYASLGIEFDSYNGEAYYEDKLGDILTELENKGLLEEGKEGAKVVDLEDKNLGMALLQKGDKATLYMTRDLAALKDRASKNPEKVLYVVDIAQTHHFKQLFAVAEKAKFLNSTLPFHVSYGRMSMPEGGMSTRKGKVVFAWKVLETAVEKAGEILREKESKVASEKLARIIGIGAIKYAVLSQNRIKDIKFTWEKILSLEGNSAPYIMYTYARANSILRKSEIRISKSETNNKISNSKFEIEELDLMRKMTLFPEVVERAAEEYMPSYITTYIYELCQLFNTFYNKLPVLNADENFVDFRLRLVKATAQVVENGMRLLNISLPEEM